MEGKLKDLNDQVLLLREASTSKPVFSFPEVDKDASGLPIIHEVRPGVDSEMPHGSDGMAGGHEGGRGGDLSGGDSSRPVAPVRPPGESDRLPPNRDINSRGSGGPPSGGDPKPSKGVTIDDFVPGKDEPILHFIRAFFVSVCAHQGTIHSSEAVVHLLGVNCTPLWQDLFTIIREKKVKLADGTEKYDNAWIQSILNLPFSILS